MINNKSPMYGYGWGYEEEFEKEEAKPKLELAPKVTTPEDIADTLKYAKEQRSLANINFRRSVELGRKLGKLQANVAKARNSVTEQCAALKMFGISPTSNQFLVLRNIVRLMKGKNEL